MRTRGSANVFAVVTLSAGTLVASLVPGGYLVFLAIASGTFNLSGLPSVLSFMAFGGAMGFVVAGSVTAGAAFLGTLTRDSQWATFRRFRYGAPFLGAVLALSWMPLVAPTAWPVWAIAAIPAVTVGVTPWLRWPGGFMNSRAIVQKVADAPSDSEPLVKRGPRVRRRGWGEVVLVAGSILVIASCLVALVFTAPGSDSIGGGRSSAAVILAGLGIIGAVIAFVSLRPVGLPPGLDRHGESDNDRSIVAAAEKP